MNDWAEFRHFRYLLTILEKQGFRTAAEELHTSQPNLTVQARQFQENAGVRLFRRSRSGRIRPTETGMAFIQLARTLLELRDEVIDLLNAIEQGEITSVCFGSTPMVDPNLFRSLCSMHRTLLPSASIRPTHGDTVQLVDEVLSGAVDAAVIPARCVSTSRGTSPKATRWGSIKSGTTTNSPTCAATSRRHRLCMK